MGDKKQMTESVTYNIYGIIPLYIYASLLHHTQDDTYIVPYIYIYIYIYITPTEDV